MWALYNKYVRQRKDKKAQEQKILVFDELSVFLLSMYDKGCLVYIEDHGRDKENFTSTLFVWFALTLGLRGKEEIEEMGAYITNAVLKVTPMDIQPYGVGLYGQGLAYLN